MHQRKAIGKRLRFAIFARDGFTCRYCGQQSDAVPLHIDHIIPVSQGGTNDEQNLITSCQDCNLGKAGRTPNFAQPTETDRLRAAQEYQEQRGAAERARAMLEAELNLEYEVEAMWITAFDEYAVDRFIIPNLRAIAREDGLENLAHYLAAAARSPVGGKYISDTQRIKYIYGIRRNIMRERGADVA